MWIYLNQGKLTICYSSNGRNVDRIDAISCGNAEQVKQTTTKLMQNKGENKISEFWNDNNEYPCILKVIEGKPSSIYCFSIDWCDVMRDRRNKCLVKSTPFQREFDQEHATRSTTKLRENEKENENSSF